MARAPYNVLVILHRRNQEAETEFALFERADLGFWQPVTGGGEDGETPIQTAQRETREETGLNLDINRFFQLQTIEYVRVTEFGWRWAEDIYVIPQYCFAVEASGSEIQLSREHKRFRWLPYRQADRMLKYDGNRTALWEINQRLGGLGPRGEPTGAKVDEIIRKLSGANMDIDLATPPGEISWQQENCP